MAGKGIIVLNNDDIRDLVNGRFVKKDVHGVTVSVVWDTYFDELIGKVVEKIKTGLSGTECDLSKIVPEEIGGGNE